MKWVPSKIAYIFQGTLAQSQDAIIFWNKNSYVGWLGEEHTCGQIVISQTWKQGYAWKHLTGVQINGSRCPGPMSQNFKYLAAVEGSLFAKGLQSCTRMTVCRQQWSMVEGPCKSGAAFLQTELGIWSELLVSSVLNNTGRYRYYSTIREASDWPQIYSVAWQWPQTYSKRS